MTATVLTDFTDLSQAIATTASGLTYAGTREVLLNTPTVLTGTYASDRMAKLTLVAEDKFPLVITLNPANKTWQSNLDKGFQAPGTRWLRLQGWDGKGQAVGNLVIYLTVSNNPLALGQLVLTVLHSTFFKAEPIDSSQLAATQKGVVHPGQSLAVARYGYVDGHLRVELKDAIAPVGKFGYFYEAAVELRKGNQILKFEIDDVPMTPLAAVILVSTPTTLKLRPVDSSQLAATQKVELLQGQSLQITGYACTRGHFRVTLTQELPGFGNTGFVYWQHVLLKRGQEVIPFDPGALTIAAAQSTIFKKRPVESATLTASERFNFPQGSYYGVASYALEAGHIKVCLTEELPGFGNTGYVFPGYVQMKRGTKIFNPLPSQVEMNIPFFSQRDNPRSPGSTCNVTAIAMALYYLGARPKPGRQFEDELLQWVITKYGSDRQTDNTILSELIKAFGFPKSTFSTGRKWADVKSELISRRPVVLGGDFTASGHIICLIGFTPQGYIVNDPWGDALTGYTSYDGRKLIYPYSYMDRVAGPDGHVWAHFFGR
jgi:hypothetical protein